MGFWCRTLRLTPLTSQRRCAYGHLLICCPSDWSMAQESLECSSDCPACYSVFVDAVPRRLFHSNVGNEWTRRDIIELTAMFELEVICHIENRKAVLRRDIVLHVLSKISTGPQIRPMSLIEMERFLRLLCAALRLHKHYGTELEDNLHLSLSKVFETLSIMFQNVRSQYSSQFRFEQCYIDFLLQHSKNILDSIAVYPTPAQQTSEELKAMRILRTLHRSRSKKHDPTNQFIMSNYVDGYANYDADYDKLSTEAPAEIRALLKEIRTTSQDNKFISILAELMRRSQLTNEAKHRLPKLVDPSEETLPQSGLQINLAPQAEQPPGELNPTGSIHPDFRYPSEARNELNRDSENRYRSRKFDSANALVSYHLPCHRTLLVSQLFSTEIRPFLL